jgi:BirA family biotin operon repressor/biotin-[acetyl-CoA-carboxylase] ligase
VLENKKLGGILTELSIDPNTGLVAYAIVGIGINCLQETFPEELTEIATSLRLAAGKNCAPAHLAARLMEELESLSHTLLTEKDKWMDAYRGSCITIGKEVKVLNGENTYSGTAVNITPDGSLVVSLADGTEKVVSSGEASVRGLFGYV